MARVKRNPGETWIRGESTCVKKRRGKVCGKNLKYINKLKKCYAKGDRYYRRGRFNAATGKRRSGKCYSIKAGHKKLRGKRGPKQAQAQ